MGECVDVKKDGGIATVVMHRKGNNGIAADLVEELSSAFRELSADETVRVVVLASEYEKYFSVGADLTSMGGVDRDAPGAGGTQRLPRLIGKARAMPMILEGTRLSAKEAEAIGLVSKAVAPEELDSAVAEIASRLEKAATRALGLAKDAVNRGLDQPLHRGLEIEAKNFAKATLTEDAVIGIMSFLQKQEPE